MTRRASNRFRAIGMVLVALACTCVCVPLPGQGDQRNSEEQRNVADLRAKAHRLEASQKFNAADSVWKQILGTDPNDPEALAGRARAAKFEGRIKDEKDYLDQLRTINPNDPTIAQIETMGTAQDQQAQLHQAESLTHAGQYADAMAHLRQAYPYGPPDGDEATSYYETEAGSPEGRPEAIAKLRALMDKYPQNSGYQVALGKILTYNPRTRAEGLRLLEKQSGNAEAARALQDSSTWTSKGGGSRVRGETPSQAQVAAQPSTVIAASIPHHVRRALTPEQRAAWAAQRAERHASQASYRARSAEDKAAYKDLAAKRYKEAGDKFLAILDKSPKDAQARAGMGYVDMAVGNFSGALSYLNQAEEDGLKDPAVEKALAQSRFYNAMQLATAALKENDTATAGQQFKTAAQQRPNDPEPLLGLGGTLQREQQPEAAIGYFAQAVKLAPGDMRAWRGLFGAQAEAMKYNEALATDKRTPPRVKADLLRDREYLRTLAVVYTALGRDAEAQRVLQAALNLPVVPGAKGPGVDVQLQYAALLSTAGRKEQAIQVYRQVLAVDPVNLDAYIGLVQNEHQLERDSEAYQILHQQMPQEVYTRAMQEAGFETTVAAVDEAAGHVDEAQKVLEAFLNNQQTAGQKPFVPAELELAGIYLQLADSETAAPGTDREDAVQAFKLYHTILKQNPERTDAWKGILAALHATGHDQEALQAVHSIPPAIRLTLENDAVYLQAVGSIYAGLGEQQEAMLFFYRVQQHYAAQHIAPPADVEIQEAWLLYNSHNDAGLYNELMTIGDREDLTTKQRFTVQTIWTNWAVRRAGQASDRGDYRRAIAILNATAMTFPGNPAIVRALASGYASAGMSKEAIAIFRAQDLNQAPAADYRAAIGAALSGNDLRDAEIWLRFGLDEHPRDPKMLVLAAKFEQARGDPNRAADYYRAALAVMPRPDPGAELAGELSRPAPQTPAHLPGRHQPQDLATLLSEPDARSGSREEQPRPYLPSYNGGTGAAPQFGTPGSNGPMVGGDGAMGSPQNKSYPGSSFQAQPAPIEHPASPDATLKDYGPQSRLEFPSGANAGGAELHLHPAPAVEAKFGPYVAYDPSVETPRFASPDHRSGGSNAVTYQTAVEGISARVAVAAYEGQQAVAQDGTPIVSYVPNAAVPTAKPATRQRITSRPASEQVKARAAAIRANQAAAPEAMTGQSHPPVETYETTSPANFPTPQIRNAQYSGSQYNQQVPQPQAGTYSSSQDGSVQQSGGSYGQQYPQPTNGNTSGSGSQNGTHRRVRHKTATQPQPAPQPQQAPVQAQEPLNYPGYAPPLGGYAYPQAGSPYPLGQAPSDYDLQQRNLPPLRGYYDPRPDPAPLTERQQAELDLATIQGSYSGWVGGSVIGRYRSGTPGIDRLATLEVPFEASVVIDNGLRLSVIPKVVFLNNGQLDTTSGNLGTTPVLGTLSGTTTAAPQQQFASGVGGEFQLATNTFAAAVGFTPYEFLVSNLIGRGQWRPANGHFTFYGGRDPVRETELSYAGLRDPGSATTTYGGNVWGGVVQTGGGVRFDSGDARAGLYVQGEGADLTGYHVLDNRKYDGTMGAYFRVRTWPEYGTLNIGGLFFGEHFDHNERGETYGLGGYFSPEAYFLAAVPLTFSGHYGTNVHYVINGSIGVQTFQEDNQIYYPLDPTLESSAVTTCETASGTTTGIINRTCGQDPVNSNTGLNYSIDTKVSYQATEHWIVGAFFSGNNTNNYNTVSGGFYGRYTFRPEYPTVDYPTGLFPVEGFRPLRVP